MNRDFLKHAARDVLLILSFIALFPTQFYARVVEGLDASWQLSLYLAHQQHFIFGKDYVFPYGPLGVLAIRYPVAAFKFWYLCADIFLVGVFACLLVSWRKRLSIFGALLLLSSAILCGPGRFFHDQVIYIFILTIFCLERFEVTKSRLWFAAAAALTVLCFFIKVNLGLFLLIAMLGYSCWVGMFPLLLLSGLFVAVSILLPVDLAGYIRGSWELIIGFAEAMSLSTAEAEAALSFARVILVFTLALGALAIILQRRLSSASIAICILMGGMFILYKQAFTRADAHYLSYFQFAAIFVFGLYLLTYSWVRKSCAALLFTTLACAIYLSPGNLAPAKLISRIRGPLGYFADLSSEASYKSTARLPVEFKNLIANSSVDFIPHEIALAYAEELNYKPRPVVQSYSAYTPYLDQLNAQKYFQDGPDFLVFEMNCIDRRYCFWDEPRTKLAMMLNYSVLARSESTLLLKRRTSPVYVEQEFLSSQTLTFGSWIDIPTSNGLTLVSIKISKSILGSFDLLWAQAPALYVSIELEDGSRRKFRVLRRMLDSPLIVGRFISSIQDAEQLFKGEFEKLSKIRRLKIYSRAKNRFASNLNVVYENFAVSSN